MKVYDTDENAVAAAARKRFLAKFLVVFLAVLTSGLMAWGISRL